MITVNLELSRQLQERWPERKAYFMHYKTTGLVEPAKWTVVDADDIYDYGEPRVCDECLADAEA